MKDNKYTQATRKMLYNYSNLATDLYIKRLELEHIKTNDGLTGVSCDGIGGCNNDNTSKVEKTGDRNIEQAEKLRNDITNIKLNIDRIDKVLEVLTETEKQVVEKRFINRDKKDWCIIADEIGFSERQARRIGNKAVAKVTSLLFGIKSYTDLPLFKSL